MLNVYCIPGMGVDERVFKNINPDNCKLHHIKWQTPVENESLERYALRLAEQIDTENPFAMIGVSFGGMCATEIAKKHNPVKTFVISSCKQSSELPFKIALLGKFRIYRFLRDIDFINLAMLIKNTFGIRSPEQMQHFKEMLRASPKNYFRGAFHCVATWANNEIPKSVVHIHGTEDKLLPISNIKSNYLIQEGDHFMVVNRADEISKIINKELETVF
jgi:surfactin synthase thioesterase subunit